MMGTESCKSIWSTAHSPDREVAAACVDCRRTTLLPRGLKSELRGTYIIVAGMEARVFDLESVLPLRRALHRKQHALLEGVVHTK